MRTSTLLGTTAVVTGAGRGLGAALAIVLADEGCSVVLCGRDGATLDAVSHAIRTRSGREPKSVILDLARPDSIAGALERIAETSDRLDLLINNGAMWLEARSEPYSSEEVLGVVGAAVSGTFLLSQGLLPCLARSSRPDIVTIGSISGLPNAALQTASVPFYAAKHAQIALADGFRQMLIGTPVRSMCVHPPYLDDISPTDPEWDLIPARRKGARATNRDVVEAVMFAVSRPRHVVMSSITIDADDGGMFG